MSIKPFVIIGMGLSLMLGLHSPGKIHGDETTWTQGIPFTLEPAATLTGEQLSAIEASMPARATYRQVPIRLIKKNKTPNPNSPPEHIAQNFGIYNPLQKAADFVGSQLINFVALTFNDCFETPPDSMGAVGPTQYIAFCNGRIRSFNKTTGQRDGGIDIGSDAFFSPVLPSGSFAGDARIKFDRLSNTWIMIELDVPNSNVPNHILFAISRNSTITPQSTWTFYSIPASNYGAGEVPFIDYPTIGIDRNALYFGANIFGNNFFTSAGWVVNKGALLQHQTLQAYAFPHLIDPNTGTGPVSPQGVTVFDYNSPYGYFLGVDANNSGLLALRQISNPGGVPLISSTIPINIPATAYPLNVPHLGNNNGTNGYLEGIDDRLSISHIRANHLFTSHNIGVDSNGVSNSTNPITRNGSRWYEIDLTNPNSPSLVQYGTLFQPGNPSSYNERFYWMPSIMTNGPNTLMIGCSTAGAQYYADTAYTFRYASDPRGMLRAPIQYTNSSSPYNPSYDSGGGGGRRWGDLSSITIDPQDNMTMWTIQEYSYPPGIWGCQVLRLLAPPPPKIGSVQPSQIPVSTASQTLTINGIPGDGNAYYDNRIDAGPKYARLMTITMGDVQVQSFKVLSPTQISVVVSTANATRGTKTIVIKNPDGQIVSAAALTVQ